MDENARLAERIGTAAQRRGLTIGVAESLTGGLLSSSLASAPDASVWFAGGIVAYSRMVKHGLLRVPEGPVVSRVAAQAMATGAARELNADIAVAVTGVGGPDPQDDQPPGTVFLAVHSATGTSSEWHRFAGNPAEICGSACGAALRALLAVVAPEADGS